MASVNSPSGIGPVDIPTDFKPNDPSVKLENGPKLDSGDILDRKNLGGLE